ncbi:lipocalin family protein [Usitatibacter palustris]|uniref:Outer membrane lipoprotein Blc n=1 Tax=Usitatibacter palustris TaxID=2732487 RepID=A0A6M4H338_9PROT|nr:lipocalin family protein [Usitatibacter palustris]QJR13735.1 Outer membrane lipoprotein Blc [Usitatibacter palustris]
MRIRLLAPALLLLSACQSAPLAPIATVAQVDLPRFMGDWYVIASIPTFIERDAFNAIESYRLASDGSIETTFTFRAGALDGPLKTYTPRGFVLDTKTNAVWGMRFVWPILADYRIVDVAPDYSLTVIGREKRDYAWIMARTPAISGADYERAVRLLAAQGYDVAQLRKVPQQWISAR